jgi:Chromatin remodeling protein, contains PhD zinc finger
MSYLEEFITSINYLPGEVCRSLELIKLLDEKSKASIEDFSNLSADYFSSIKKETQGSYSENTDLLNIIRKKHEDSLSFAEEKVAISKQLIDMVDFHIGKLKQDLDAYKREISAENENLEDKVNKKIKIDKNLAMNLDMDPIYMDNPDMPDEYDMQGDENKTYCYCNKGSYGEMIECENSKVVII